MDSNFDQLSGMIDRSLDPILWVVTSRFGSDRGGLLATFVQKASLVPWFPRIAVGIAKHHYTWHLIQSSGAFGLHLMSEDDMPWIERFGLRTGWSSGDKLADMPVTDGTTGSPILKDAVPWLDCRVEASLDTGDRTVYLAEVVAGGSARTGQSLRVSRMLAKLPTDQRDTLSRLLAHDVLTDAAAIRAWRARCASFSTSKPSSLFDVG
jgi:flavin reductase (DIM6/NTAB) family NADH-FMN oxidoreductase RutF